jgi:hypothetical protein
MGRTGKGGARCPPAAAVIVVVIDGGGGVGADNQRPPSHAPNRWPADDIATIVVIPPVAHSPAGPLPILCVIVLLLLSYSSLSWSLSSRHSCCIPHLRPPSTSHPVPSSSAIVLADSSLDSLLRNASVIHKLVEGGLCCCCM